MEIFIGFTGCSVKLPLKIPFLLDRIKSEVSTRSDIHADLPSGLYSTATKEHAYVSRVKMYAYSAMLEQCSSEDILPAPSFRFLDLVHSGTGDVLPDDTVLFVEAVDGGTIKHPENLHDEGDEQELQVRQIYFSAQEHGHSGQYRTVDAEDQWFLQLRSDKLDILRKSIRFAVSYSELNGIRRKTITITSPTTPSTDVNVQEMPEVRLRSCSPCKVDYIRY